MRIPLLLAAGALAVAIGATGSEPVIRTGYHLAARPWQPLNIPRERYLDAVEGVCRFSARHQDADGAIIDPFLHREYQYATPYFANAVGVLISAGRARDLQNAGVKAMEHATKCFGGGRDQIPDQHGEFFIAVLTEALQTYAPLVPAQTLERWRERMRKPRAEVVRGGTNNWETYVMKGEWLRFKAGLVDRPSAVAAIEGAWEARQRARFSPAPWFLYHDRSSDPDTLSVEAVGRGNVLALVHLGYDGPSAAEMRRIVEPATKFTLDLQDPSGQVPANGRTDDHVWVDIGYQLAFEVMAERTHAAGDDWLAGQYRHAAMLAFQNIQRWKRSDGEWAGSYYITKNHFDPALRVGYQDASQYSNYSGSFMFHLAEAYEIRRTPVAEHPAPAEIGGYAIAMDREFGAAFANAGGMQIEANMRGQGDASSGNRWTPLGVVRFARAGWDTRLGPADGALTSSGGVSFAPAFREGDRWLRMADLSTRYEGFWSASFVHPLLVRCAVEYRPKAGRSGPTFRNELVVTPDGVMSAMTKTSAGQLEWAVTWPLLENDGNPLQRSGAGRIRSVKYPKAADQENFIALETAEISEEPLQRGSYGDLRPLRVSASKVQHTFIYPQSAGDPQGSAVAASLKVTNDGFQSVLGREIDLDGDGRADATFSAECGFLIQLKSAKAIAIETDRDVDCNLSGRKLRLKAHRPQTL
jgi:hypothetical protein